jgi:hypothetical protein
MLIDVEPAAKPTHRGGSAREGQDHGLGGATALEYQNVGGSAGYGERSCCGAPLKTIHEFAEAKATTETQRTQRVLCDLCVSVVSCF